MVQISQARQNPGSPTPSAGMQGKSASEEKLSQYFSRDQVNPLVIVSIVITKHLCLCLSFVPVCQRAVNDQMTIL